MHELPFQVIVDKSFIEIFHDTELNPVDKKHVLSIVNDFEDGKWRYDKFQRFIWDNVSESALSFRERNSLAGDPASLLAEASKKLRFTDNANDISKGSELAEIVLYGIMKHRFNALPVVPKIFYKQNTQDNAKGSDSVHIVVHENDFSLWFGEAKFYNSIEDARLGSIIQSVGNSLLTEKLKKENSIITDVSDIDYLIKDQTLNKNIKLALSPRESIDNIKPKLHIPILLLHECLITGKTTQLSDEYVKETCDYHKERSYSYFEKQIIELSSKIHLYSEISFHIILFPVPLKEPIVNKFLDNAKFHQRQ